MYVVHRDVIERNVKSIRDAFYENDIPLKLCYSYKTNMMPEVLSIMDRYEVCPEVVSEHEFKHIPKSCNNTIICNGVAMSYEELAEKVRNDHCIVNFNDVTSARIVRDILDDDELYHVGLRIRFDDDSRFGIHVNDLNDAIKTFRNMNFSIICLQCHVSGTRTESKYKEKVKNMIDAVLQCGVRPEIIDFGGNMYGIMDEWLSSQFSEVCSFEDYAKIIASEVNRLDYIPTVALELGTALIANAVSVVGKIIRIDEYDRIVLDIDKFTIGMVHSKNLAYTFIPSGVAKMSLSRSFKVYGCTCIEDDLLIDDFPYEPQIGDLIKFSNCGAYSYCFEPEFIIPRQEVVVV